MYRWMLALLLGASTLGIASAAAEVSHQEPEPAKPSADAKAALQHAASIRREARGQDADAKREIYLRSAEAYAVIVERFASEPQVVLEATFRQAELRRLAGDVDIATGLYEQVASSDREGPFGARAQLEIGHLYRRAKQWATAEASYEKVWTEHPGQTVYGARAMIWAGKAAESDGRLEAGRALFRRAIETFSQHPAQGVQAFDALATSLLKAGDREGAEAVVAECEGWVDGTFEPGSKERETARSSFEKMRVRKRLAKEG
ncbi:MAG: tetratricopeptide repeat protein [Planctomycetota bacterium]